MSVNKSMQVSSFDRSFAFADGVFTTFRIESQKIIFRDAHIERLRNACQRLDIACDVNEIERAFKACESASAVISSSAMGKVVISAGQGGKGYSRDKQASNSQNCSVQHQIKPLTIMENSVAVMLCNTRIPRFDEIAGLKTTNALAYVLASNELQDMSQGDGLVQDCLIRDGLIQDYDDNLIESCSANIFIEYQDYVWTPDLSRCGVAGVYRQQLLNYLESNNIPVEISTRSLDDAINAQGISGIKSAWLTNSVRGLRKIALIQTAKNQTQEINTDSPLADAIQASWLRVCSHETVNLENVK